MRLRFRSRRGVGRLCLLGSLVASIVSMLLAGAAAALPTNCTQSGATVTCTFTASGAAQAFTPPVGVSPITVTLTGASGGAGGQFNGVGGSGGLGAAVSGSVAVVGGQPLTVYVAEMGQAGSFSSSTGTGGFGYGDGGGGGGRAEQRLRIRRRWGRCLRCSRGTTPLAVAAGGGGGGGGGPSGVPAATVEHPRPMAGPAALVLPPAAWRAGS